jgi:hypothetical protein
MSFMMEIEAAQRSPLDQLAFDYFYGLRSGHPSLDFCRQTLGVPEKDEIVARRLSVAVSTVRSWRDVGRRATPGRCWNGHR